MCRIEITVKIDPIRSEIAQTCKDYRKLWGCVVQERLYLSVSLREDAMQLRGAGSLRLNSLVNPAGCFGLKKIPIAEFREILRACPIFSFEMKRFLVDICERVWDSLSVERSTTETIPRF
jgi:hypothetical protein